MTQDVINKIKEKAGKLLSKIKNDDQQQYHTNCYQWTLNDTFLLNLVIG